MKKLIYLVLIILTVSCQKNSSPAPSTNNLSTSLSAKNNDDAKVNFIKIGNQKWMAANLSVNHYRNGDVIPQVKSLKQWTYDTIGAWCWYNNDSATGAPYGKLYNWAAVNDPRGLAPEGWHIPAKEEWTKLINDLGGADHASGALKDTGTMYWHAPNTDATNSSGFTALPAGERTDGKKGKFIDLTHYAMWWSSTEAGVGQAYFEYIQFNNPYAYQYVENVYSGLSVRCVKDKP